MRPTRIYGIAVRDLRAEFAGKNFGMPIIAFLLLTPIAFIHPPEVREGLGVHGQVPQVVLDLPQAYTGPGTGFYQKDGVIYVHGWRIPTPIREALDGDTPVVFVEVARPPPRIPKRSMLLALVSASTLTGAVSGSISGERARHTLQALLSAAITRREIVTGKWLAWSAVGAAAAVTAALFSILVGNLHPGLWLTFVPIVPALTVAVGLWLVRRSTDVISGTSVSIRIMPAVLIATGISAWLLSGIHDLLGAAVPLGGALLYAGDFWSGALGPFVVALISSVGTTALLLDRTAAELEEKPSASPVSGEHPGLALLDGSLSLATWWTLVPGAALWGWAGNPVATESIPVRHGLWAGAAMFGMFAMLRRVRTIHVRELPAFGRPDGQVGIAALGLIAAGAIPALAFENQWIQIAADRLQAGIIPPAGLGMWVIFAQEWWFRGWMQHRAGWLPVAIAWAVILSPHNPVAGLFSGLMLGWIARRGWGHALFAHLIAWAALSMLG